MSWFRRCACSERDCTAREDSSMALAVSTAMLFTSEMERLISSLAADYSSLAAAMART